MAKSDRPISRIDVSRARQQKGEPSFAEGKPVNGLDTETADGDIFAIGCYYGDSGEYVSRIGNEKPLDGLEVLEFLTSASMRGSLNVWYNLNFDANVVLKALDRENLRDISLHNRTEFEANDKTWEIVYIPKKVLKISDGAKHTYEHYDASQFTYSGGLESAAEDWLGEEGAKLNDGLDVERFGLAGDGSGELNEYLKANMPDIRKYLKQDCKLTARIFREIVDTAEGELDTRIPMGKPYSTGYMAGDYIRNRLEYKPGYHVSAVQSAAWDTYRGGRFEVIKRGDVGRVAGPDINSAYPAVMADLPDPATLDWRLFGDGNRREPIGDADLDAADYGFVEATLWTDATRPVQPFAVKNPDENGRIEYPALNGVRMWVLKDTFEYALETGLVESYELHGAVLGYEVDSTRFPFSFFRELYDKRKRLEAEGRDKPAKLLKIVMNSIYGKTCQTNLKLQPVAQAHEILDDLEPGDSLHVDDIPDKYDLVTDHRGEPYLEYAEAGRLFNPFLATYITGRTRLQLLRGVIDNGLEDSVVMLATDCLMFEAEAFEGTELHRQAEADPDSYADALGGWDYDYEGDGFVVGSGVYQVDIDGKDKPKLGLRGFKDFYSDSNEFDTLTEAAEMYPDGIPVTTSRPVTYGDILHLNKSLTEIGRFTESERTLTASMDTKRSWANDNPDFGDLLSGPEGSAPKIFHGDRMETKDL